MLVKAREIKLKSDEYENQSVSIKIGTAENRDRPETIYVEISFWIKNRKLELSSKELRKSLHKQLRDIYDQDLDVILRDNPYFPKYKDNLYILNIPENIDYNGKKNFVSIDVTLHTVNLEKGSNLPLSNKKNTELYDEALKIAQTICRSTHLNNNDIFDISKKK